MGQKATRLIQATKEDIMADANRTENKTVAIVGAGLVGALSACIMAQRGYKVNLFEYRKDIRTLEHVPGRSINLAMSVRGRTALRKVGVEDQIIKEHAIPMRGRMIHATDGSMKCIPYNKDGQCIYSVGRRFLNEVLLTKAETFPNVTCYFEHRLTSVKSDGTQISFTNPSTNVSTSTTADLIIGCDGAYSAVRKEMLKQPQFNYSQTYIPHGYMELCIPPDSKGQFAMPANYLHIWPRGSFMMIALPNQDHSWTVTLFMPFPIFDSLSSPDKLLNFFTKYYPDSIPLIGRERLIKDFFANTALPMISVKCFPYHMGASCVILGDAAHAMVPFYGQGMNCGLEDCLVLDEMLTLHGEDLTKALAAYSEKRNPDAEAIVDLAMYNYVEMRDLVNSRLFLLRKTVDNLLYSIFPRSWVPLYTMVTFSREPYSSCVHKKQWQDKVLRWSVVAMCGAAAVSFYCRRPALHLDHVQNVVTGAVLTLRKFIDEFYL
ncbi:Kynurenine 3-monooxygenase [Trinorchestia longiramus]|nr:Kynurenine 3-monooxygenase [Trinorchestia longiramus]